MGARHRGGIGFSYHPASLCRLVVFREHILVLLRKFWIVSVPFETALFVSVVSIKVRNTEINRNFFLGFHETNRNKRETDLVSVCFGSNRNLFLFVSRTPYSQVSYGTDLQSAFHPSHLLFLGYK